MRLHVFTLTLILQIAGILSKCDYYLGFVYNKPGCNTVDGKNYGPGTYWLEELKCRYCQCYNNAYKCCGIGINDANVTRPIPPVGSEVIVKNCNYHIVAIHNTQTTPIPTSWYRPPYANNISRMPWWRRDPPPPTTTPAPTTRRPRPPWWRRDPPPPTTTPAPTTRRPRPPWWRRDPPPPTTTPAPTTRRPRPPWFEPTEPPDLPDMADLFSMMSFSRGNRDPAATAGKQALPGPSPITLDPWAALFGELFEPPDGPEVTDPPDYIFTTTPKPTTPPIPLRRFNPPAGPRPSGTLIPADYGTPLALSNPAPQGIPPMVPIPRSRPPPGMPPVPSVPASRPTSYNIPKAVPRPATPRPVSVLSTPRTLPRKPINPPTTIPTPTAPTAVPQDNEMIDALISLMMMPDFDSEAFTETLQTQMFAKAMRSGGGFGGSGPGGNGNGGEGSSLMDNNGGGGGGGFMGNAGGEDSGGVSPFGGLFGDLFSGNGLSRMLFSEFEPM